MEINNKATDTKISGWRFSLGNARLERYPPISARATLSKRDDLPVAFKNFCIT
jgi:hypothetical protein